MLNPEYEPNDEIHEAGSQFREAFGQESPEDDPVHLVNAANGCLRCGERRLDQLVWDAEQATIRCTSCGALF
jgi:hypothetical protein